MNSNYHTKLKVIDMQSEEYQLIQSEYDIKQFNEEYQEDFHYYFIKWNDDTPNKLYGSNGIFMDSNVYFVADL